MKRSGSGCGEEHKVSAKVAEKLLEAINFEQDLKMGCEVCLASVNSPAGLTWPRERLVLKNVSGEFYLACTSRPKEDWKEIFATDVADLKNWKPSISHYYDGGEVAVFREHDTTYDLYADSTLQEHVGNVDSIREGKELLDDDSLEDDCDGPEM